MSDALLIPWTGVLAPLGERTGDGRMIEGLRFDPFPLPLRWAREDVGAHQGAVLVGQITSGKIEDGKVLGSGYIDASIPDGADLVEVMKSTGQIGVSFDLDDPTYEVRVLTSSLEAAKALDEIMWDEDASMEDVQEAIDDYTEAQGVGQEVGEYTVVERSTPDEEIIVFTDCLVRAATAVDIPAFPGAFIRLDDADPVEPTEEKPVAEGAAVVAGIAPVAPPREWFDLPRLSEYTHLTITDEGRVYGHIAPWTACYRGETGCQTPPADTTGYAHFRTGTVKCADGSFVATGVLTMGEAHAGLELSAFEAMQHYHDVSLGVADLVVGDDAHGVLVAGALRPTVTPEQVRTLRASSPSGDWRQVGSEIALVAAHAVNTPGFAVPRVSGALRDGERYALVAGMGPVRRRRHSSPLSVAELAALRRVAATQIRAEREDRAATALALARTVERDASLELVRKIAATEGAD